MGGEEGIQTRLGVHVQNWEKVTPASHSGHPAVWRVGGVRVHGQAPGQPLPRERGLPWRLVSLGAAVTSTARPGSLLSRPPAPRGGAWWAPGPEWVCPAGEGGTRRAHRAVIQVEVGGAWEPSGWGPRRSRPPWDPLPGSVLPTDPVPGEVTVGRDLGHVRMLLIHGAQCPPGLLAHWRVR